MTDWKQIEAASCSSNIRDTKGEILKIISENPNGITARKLSENLGIVPDSIRKQLKVLEKDNLVVRVKRPGNKGDLFL